jgi:hypothetical protein
MPLLGEISKINRESLLTKQELLRIIFGVFSVLNLIRVLIAVTAGIPISPKKINNFGQMTAYLPTQTKCQ